MAVNSYCAVLMDTISIQKYVFASNTLRDNLGASHIVNQLFDDIVVASLANTFDIEKDKVKEIMLHWQQEPGKILLDDPAVLFEIGVAGGGKALMFFRDSDQAKAFIETFTRDLLIKAPGLQLAVAIDEEFTPDQEFSHRLKSLYIQLTQNRNRYFPITTLQNHGITAIYSETGTSLNLYSQNVEEYISIEKATKLEAADTEEKILEGKIKKRHPDYRFSNRMDWLGQTEGNSYTAVVHIDGNNMGNWFADSPGLEVYRLRSHNLDIVTEESFWSLVDKAVCIMPKLTENGFAIQEDKDGRKHLPLRPLILGGDDITFVCEGRLGLYFAEKFLQIWTKKANSLLSKYGKPKNGEFTACAGVAIANTKYPFYRTYSFAQELCTSAKKSAREAKKGSWIDFHIISGTKSGNLEAIRKEEGVVQGLELYFGPYCLETNQEKSLQYLKKGIYEFSQSWVRSDVKELRNAFYSGKEALDTYLIDMAAKGNRLPYKERGGVDYSSKGYVDKRTPYFDMLEMMEYYPQFLLKGGSTNEIGN